MVLIFIIAALLVAVDQATKFMSVAWLQPVDTVPIIKNVLHLTYATNTGAAFGSFQGGRWFFLALTVLAIAVMIFMLVKYRKNGKLLEIGLVLTLAGAVGNMIDRVRLGYVVDMIDFRAINFAIFNFADSCITTGAAIAVVNMILAPADEPILLARRYHSGAKNDDETER